MAKITFKDTNNINREIMDSLEIDTHQVTEKGKSNRQQIYLSTNYVVVLTQFHHFNHFNYVTVEKIYQAL